MSRSWGDLTTLLQDGFRKVARLDVEADSPDGNGECVAEMGVPSGEPKEDGDEPDVLRCCS